MAQTPDTKLADALALMGAALGEPKSDGEIPAATPAPESLASPLRLRMHLLHGRIHRGCRRYRSGIRGEHKEIAALCSLATEPDSSWMPLPSTCRPRRSGRSCAMPRRPAIDRATARWSSGVVGNLVWREAPRVAAGRGEQIPRRTYAVDITQ